MKRSTIVILVLSVLALGCTPFSRTKSATGHISGWSRQGVTTAYVVTQKTMTRTVPEAVAKAREAVRPEEQPVQETETKIIVIKHQEIPKVYVSSRMLRSVELIELLRSAGYQLTTDRRVADLGLDIDVDRERLSAFGSRASSYTCTAALVDRRGGVVGYGTGTSMGGARIKLPWRQFRSISIPDMGGEDKAIYRAIVGMICDHKGLHQED